MPELTAQYREAAGDRRGLGLTAQQAEVVAHRDGPLLVLGAAGTGKTVALAARHAALGPDGTLALTPAPRAFRALAGGSDELEVHALPAFALRLLRDEAAEARVDPFLQPVTPADRVAVLRDRVDDLGVEVHDFRGSPATLLAGFVDRIDELKAACVDAATFARWAAALPAGDPRAAREREFAALYDLHERLLAEAGVLDEGGLVLAATALLRDHPHVRARAGARFAELLVDGAQDLDPAGVALVAQLAAGGATLVAAGDDDAALRPGALGGLAAAVPGARTLRLERVFRSRARLLAAARAVVEPLDGRLEKPCEADGGGEVRFWRCEGERAQAQAAAAEAERLLRSGVAADDLAIVVRSVRREGGVIASALEERGIAYRFEGAAAWFGRAEVRDVLAWLRLLVDPADASAVARALARPPVDLRAADLARCVQIARRRKLDMVAAVAAALESPQLPPEGRDRLLAFLKLHRSVAAAIDVQRPDLFVHRLVDRLGLRREGLFAAQPDVVERLRALARLGELAAAHVRRFPQATARDFARAITAAADAGSRAGLDEDAGDAAAPGRVAVLTMDAARAREFAWVLVLGLQAAQMPGAWPRAVEPVPDALLEAPRDEEAAARRLLHAAMTRARDGLVLACAADPPSPFVEDARALLGGAWEARGEELFGPDEPLHAAFQALRDELLGSIRTVGGRLGELRFDTDLDVAHGVVRYLELLKLAALLQRPEGQAVEEALPLVNAVLAQAATAQQREVLATSPLDDALLDAEQGARARAAATAARAEPSLEPFLPRRGDGLVLSASDIETYRTCPLKYKFARVFRIPTEPTTNQRFGIVVHQVLERYHASGGRTVDELLGLLDAGWRRGGLGAGDEARQLRGKAEGALRRYHERTLAERSEVAWLERSFQFRLGAHTLRGRVDRVDRLPGGGHEVIDYKTGRPRTVEQLREDVQLALYSIGAREAWQLDDVAAQTYHYVLDDEKVQVPSEALETAWIEDTVLEVAEGIQGQGFEPTPSYTACAMCDFRIACPAAER
jgi:DNA helicase II / ATP-dependent DNA helicase PcrA